MSNNNIELTRRRVLGGIATVGAASAAAGAGTFAFFSDTETSENNEVTAGTLDLTLNGGGSTSISFTDGFSPGNKGYVAIELNNQDGIDANIASVNIGSVDDGFSNNLVSDTDGNNDGDGELDGSLEIEAFIVTSGGFTSSYSIGTTQGSTVNPADVTATTVVSDGTSLSGALGRNSPDSSVSLNSDETKYFVLNYKLPNLDSTQNNLQGDGVKFDIQIKLKQV